MRAEMREWRRAAVEKETLLAERRKRKAPAFNPTPTSSHCEGPNPMPPSIAPQLLSPHSRQPIPFEPVQASFLPSLPDGPRLLLSDASEEEEEGVTDKKLDEMENKDGEKETKKEESCRRKEEAITIGEKEEVSESPSSAQEREDSEEVDSSSSSSHSSHNVSPIPESQSTALSQYLCWEGQGAEAEERRAKPPSPVPLPGLVEEPLRERKSSFTLSQPSPALRAELLPSCSAQPSPPSPPSPTRTSPPSDLQRAPLRPLQTEWAERPASSGLKYMPTTREEFRPIESEWLHRYAPRLAAVLRGFLLRRLLDTYKISELRKMIKEVGAELEALGEDEGGDPKDQFYATSLQSHKRQAALQLFNILQKPVKEQMSLIAADRERKTRLLLAQSTSEISGKSGPVKLKRLSLASEKRQARIPSPKILRPKPRPTTPAPRTMKMKKEEAEKSLLNKTKPPKDDLSLESIRKDKAKRVSSRPWR